MTDFEKYAVSNGIGTNLLNSYEKHSIFNSAIEPVILEERKTHCAPTSIFSRLLSDRIIFIRDEIDDDTSNIVQAQLLYLSNISDEKISIYVNTPGGVVTAGLGIYDTMQIIKPDVATICTGLAASMGSILLCAGTKGERQMLPHSRVMIHQPLGGAYGQAADVVIRAKELENCRNELTEILAQHSGQPFEKVFADMDRDHWMNAQEALEYGIVDSIIKTQKS